MEYVRYNKSINIHTTKNYVLCFKHHSKILDLLKHSDVLISELMHNLSNIFSMFGTKNFNDMIRVCFSDVILLNDKVKINIINEFFHPTGLVKCKMSDWIKTGGYKKSFSCIPYDLSNNLYL